MKRIWNYFCVEARRSLRLIANSILSLVVLVAVTLAGIWGIHSWIIATQDFSRITVAVVMDEEDDITKFFANFVSGMDSVRSVCDFVYMGQVEAQEKIKESSIEVAILLPKGFYEDVDAGVNTPVSVLFAPNCEFNVEVFSELLQAAVSMVQITEAGVYAATDVGEVYELTMRRGKMQEFLSILYLEAAYGRGAAFDSCMLQETGEVNLNQYYLVVGILFLLVMGGVIFAFFYQKRNRVFEQMISVAGVHVVWQSVVKLILMSLYILLAFSIIYGVAIKLSEVTGLIMLSYEPFVWKWMPALAFSIAGFFHGIYSIFGTKGSMGLLLCNAIMFVCAGGFVPMVYFPKWIQGVGQIMPLRFWMNYLQEIFFGNGYDFPILSVLVIGLLFSIMGTCVKCVRT